MSRTKRSLGDRRRAARVAAVQALYQMILNGGTPEDIVAEFVAFRLREDDGIPGTAADVDVDLFTDLVLGAAAGAATYDRLIETALDKDRKIKRLEILMQSILRAGVYELSARDDIDTALTISEYVAVADAFFNEREPALVNAVLDRVARTLAAESNSAEPAHGATQER